MGNRTPTQSPKNDLEKAVFSTAFNTLLPLPTDLESNLEGALQHVLGNPGSLIRPRITHQMAIAYGVAPQRAQYLAIALEYFHSASLLFDDLPCMDDALERRGVACTHLLYGEDGAILAALALINRAYGLLWKSVEGCAPGQGAIALEYVEQRLGVAGLLNGESLDLHYRLLPNSLATTERVALAKTVSLIRLTLVLPAILANAPRREMVNLERLSVCWGLAYQIVDDLKDILQCDVAVGKTTARDALLGHPNTAAVIGVPKAVERLRRLLKIGDHALERLLVWQPGLEFLKQFRNELQNEFGRAIVREEPVEDVVPA